MHILGVGPPNTVSYSLISSFRSLVCSLASNERLLIYSQHISPTHRDAKWQRLTSSSIFPTCSSNARFSALSFCSSAKASRYSFSSFCSFALKISLLLLGCEILVHTRLCVRSRIAIHSAYSFFLLGPSVFFFQRE